MIIGLSGKLQSGKDTVCKIIQYLIFSNKIKNKEIWTYELFIKEFDFIPINEYDNQLNIDEMSGWQRKLFAGKLKDIVCLLIGCTREQLEDNEFKERELGEEWTKIVKGQFQDQYIDREVKLTPRKLLQLLGTDCGRDIIHPNIWCNALFADWKPIIQFNTITNPYPNWIITDVRFTNEVKAIEDRGGIVIRVDRAENLRVKQWDRTCHNCNIGFDFEAWETDKEKKDQLCPSCNSMNHSAVLYKADTHLSETSLDNHKFKYTINNDGTINQLIETVEIVLKELSII